MYLPYFRGKQMELKALEELLDADKLAEEIIPIIEPIKFSKVLEKVVNKFISKKRKIIIIHNPKVEDFFNNINEQEKEKFEKWLDLEYVIVGHILNKNSINELKYLEERNINKKEVVVLALEMNKVTLDMTHFKYLIKNQKNKSTSKQRICIDDKFNKKNANREYVDVEFFSNEHNLYEDRLEKGFSDYSVIGKGYKKGGRTPLNIAIHIVYLDKSGSMYIRHFVSEKRGSQREMFNDANKKLCEWANENNYNNEVIEEFKKNKFPGLAGLKKLAIKQHLLVVREHFNKSKINSIEQNKKNILC